MIDRILHGASNLLAIVAGGAVILMMLHINLDVAMRYILAAPFANTIEIVSTYYIVAIVFLPLALVERLNANIASRFSRSIFPSAPRNCSLPAFPSCAPSALEPLPGAPGSTR